MNEKGTLPSTVLRSTGRGEHKDDNMLLVLEKEEMTDSCRKSRLALSRILHLS